MGNKATGWSGSGSATFHYNTQHLQKIINKDIKIQVKIFILICKITNEDPTSRAGVQIVELIGCNIDGGVLAKFDADGEYLDESIDFTFEDFKIAQEFNKLEGM